MLQHLAFSTVVVLCLVSALCGAPMQVNFTAELDPSVSDIEGPALVEGSFSFDVATARDGQSDTLVGPHRITELLEFRIKGEPDLIIPGPGLVITMGFEAEGLKSPLAVSPQGRYLVQVGEVTYPPDPPQIFGITDSEGNIVATGTDFDDLHVYNIFDLPWVHRPAITLSLYLKDEVDFNPGESLVPPGLDKLSSSELTFHVWYEGWGIGVSGNPTYGLWQQTATYRITSLEIVPEPTSLLLTSAGLLSLNSRRRRSA